MSVEISRASAWFLLVGALLLLSKISGNDAESRSHWPGTPVSLLCRSDEEVDCIWTWNGRAINIGDRYRFVASKGGSRTKDCSVVIVLFHYEDVGNWSCWSMSTDATEGELLAFYDLTMRTKQNDAYVKTSPRGGAVDVGANITLKCQFLVALEECFWLRNGQPVDVRGRYAYRGEGCALAIASARPIDAGSWHCATPANNAFGYIQSKEAVLTLTAPTTSPRTPSANVPVKYAANRTAKTGSTVVLDCAFLQPAKCVWSRQGYVIHVGYRYAFARTATPGSRRTDCSLKISNVQQIDHGRWRCVAAADDVTDAVQSDEVFLKIESRTDSSAAIRQHPRDLAVHLGTNVTFQCEFNATVDCNWRRNGKVVLVRSRYAYVGPASRNVTDCSVAVWAVAEIDLGTWTCESLANYTHWNTEATEVRLSVLQMPTVPEILGEDKLPVEVLNVTRKVGSLTCVSKGGNPAARLRWKGDGWWLPEPDSTSRPTADGLYDTHLRMDVPRLRSTYGSVSVLECVASHPTFQGDRSTEIMFRWSSENLTDDDVSNDRPVIVKHPTGGYIPLWSSVTLECSFDRPLACRWIHVHPNNETTTYDVRRDATSSDCALTLSQFSQMHFGSWQCTDAKALHSNAAYLYQQKMGRVVIQWNGKRPDEISLRDHFGAESLTCHGFGLPAPDLQWYRNGTLCEAPTQVVHQQDYYEMQHVVLRWDFDRYPRDTFGNWTTLIQCVVTHPGLEGPLHDEVSVISNLAPWGPFFLQHDDGTKWYLVSSAQIQPSGSGLYCGSFRGYPPAELWWTVDGRNVSGAANVTNDGRYGLRRGSDADDLFDTVIEWRTPAQWRIPRRYATRLYCTVAHPLVRISSASIGVEFINPTDPDVVVQSEAAEFVVGLPAHLRCQFDKPTDCCWKLDGLLTDPEQHGYSYDATPDGNDTTDCSITFVRFSADLAGRWRCCSRPQAHLEDIVLPTETRITVDPGPPCTDRDPVIMFHHEVVTDGRLELGSRDQLRSLTCISSEGGSIPHLSWKVNGASLPEEHLRRGRPGRHGLFTAELEWMPSRAEETFGEDETTLSCVKEMDDGRLPCSANVTVVVQEPTYSSSREISSSPEESESGSNAYVVVGVSVAILLGVVIGVSTAFYIRFHRTSSGSDGSVISCQRWWWWSLTTCTMNLPKDEPLVAYSAEADAEEVASVSNHVY